MTLWYFEDYVEYMLSELASTDKRPESGNANSVHLIKDATFSLRGNNWIQNIGSEEFWTDNGFTSEDREEWKVSVEKVWRSSDKKAKVKSFNPCQASTVTVPAQHVLMFEKLPLKLKRAVTDFSNTSFYNDKSPWKTTTPFVTWLNTLVTDTEKVRS